MSLRYVNNADVLEASLTQALAETSVNDPANDPAKPTDSAPPPDPAYDFIELLFFAYRDFVSDPDRILADYGFGRAHHRVLHFVSRRPGLTIAELLDILRITKQSLNRVLKELIDKGFIEQRAGEIDRRQRMLFPTSKGRALALSMAEVQSERVNRALAACGSTAAAGAHAVLRALIDAGDTVGGPRGARRGGGGPR